MQTTQKRKLTGFEFQSLNFEKVEKPLPFQLWEVKRESEIHDDAPDSHIKHFRHDLVAVRVESFSMSGVHTRIAETLTDATALPEIYMIELEPGANAAYI